MKLRRFCVTTMDNWTSVRKFWTFSGAIHFAATHYPASHIFIWNSAHRTWQEIKIWDLSEG